MLLEKRRTLPQRILRQIRIETHQSERRETDQSGDCNIARCKRVVVAVGNCTRAMCVRPCTSLSVFVYRVRALSAETPIYTRPVCRKIHSFRILPIASNNSSTQFNFYVLTKSVSVEAVACEQLAQSRYAAAPGRVSNSRPLDRKSDALPLRHHATLSAQLRSGN